MGVLTWWWRRRELAACRRRWIYNRAAELQESGEARNQISALWLAMREWEEARKNDRA